MYFPIVVGSCLECVLGVCMVSEVSGRCLETALRCLEDLVKVSAGCLEVSCMLFGRGLGGVTNVSGRSSLDWSSQDRSS